LQAIAPQIFEVSKRKEASVHDALSDSKWITDISVEKFSVEHITQFVNLLQDITLTPGTEDTIVWTLTSNVSYSMSSAYRA
jgi:hypothetical protein